MLSKIDNGQISPSLNTLQVLVTRLDLPMTSLFTAFEEKRDCSFVAAGQGVLALDPVKSVTALAAGFALALDNPLFPVCARCGLQKFDPRGPTRRGPRLWHDRRVLSPSPS